MKTKVAVLAIACLALLLPLPAAAGDEEDLEALLDEFLSNAHRLEAHQRFWGDELVYTSSDGTRTDKPAIIASFEGAEEPDVPDTQYFAEDVDVRVYGDTAVVAFKLVGAPTTADPDAKPNFYFNTGTFVKRDGQWLAIAWQATKMKPDE